MNIMLVLLVVFCVFGANELERGRHVPFFCSGRTDL